MLLIILAAAALPAATVRAATLGGIDPAWSPDGKKVAWAASTLTSLSTWQIWTARSDGSGARMAVRGDALSEGVDQLDWFAPKTVAFLGNYTLFVARLGGKPRVLVSNVEDPSFSRDSTGDRFAVDVSACGQGRCPSQIVVVNRKTGRRSTIGGPKTYFVQPSLSPDGSHVVFTNGAALSTARIDGTGMHRIASCSCASWSPDGRRILFLGAGGSLRVVSPAGGRSVVLIARNVPCSDSPFGFDWSPDGRRVALSGPRGGILVIDVATRKMRTLRVVPGGPRVCLVAGRVGAPRLGRHRVPLARSRRRQRRARDHPLTATRIERIA